MPAPSRVFLIDNSVPLARVRLVDLPTNRLVEALRAGEVDAISSWEPIIYRGAQALGEEALVLTSDKVLRHTFNLVVAPEDLARRPDRYERLLRALADALDFAAREPEQAKTLIAEHHDLPLAFIDAHWDEYEFRLLLDQGLLLTLEAEARWYQRRSGRADAGVPNFLPIFEPAPLRRVAPDSVTLID